MKKKMYKKGNKSGKKNMWAKLLKKKTKKLNFQPAQ